MTFFVLFLSLSLIFAKIMSTVNVSQKLPPIVNIVLTKVMSLSINSKSNEFASIISTAESEVHICDRDG